MKMISKHITKLQRLAGLGKVEGAELEVYIETSFKDLTDDEIWEGCEIALNQPYKLTGQSVIQALEKVMGYKESRQERKRDTDKLRALQDKIESTPREHPNPDMMKEFYARMNRQTERFRDLDDYHVVEKPKTGFEWREKDDYVNGDK